MVSSVLKVSAKRASSVLALYSRELVGVMTTLGDDRSSAHQGICWKWARSGS